MKYWLFKSEPTSFSIDHLAKQAKQTTHWDGVRNYQARNMLRDEIKKGDQGLFYHSNCNPPGIAGTFEVVAEAHPDFTAWDSRSHHYDPDSTEDNPRWFMVDIRLLKKFNRIVTLDELKKEPSLKEMVILRKGNRLSITPVTKAQWEKIINLATK